jgi:hypothetical protein
VIEQTFPSARLLSKKGTKSPRLGTDLWHRDSHSSLGVDGLSQQCDKYDHVLTLGLADETTHYNLAG